MNITIGKTYTHKLHGQCIVLHKSRNGFWIQVWGGPTGDKLYTFKGVKADEFT